MSGGDGVPLNVRVRLLDAAGQEVTSASAATAGSNGGASTVRLSGFAIGDAGASGPFTVEVVVTLEIAGCPPSAPAQGITGTVQASDYAGWATTIQRLRERVAQFAESGDLAQQAAAELAGMLPPEPPPGAVAAFLDRLAAATSAGDTTALAAARLRSLAERLLG